MKALIYGILLSGTLVTAAYGMEEIPDSKKESTKRISCCGAQKKSKGVAKVKNVVNRSKTLQEWKKYCDTHLVQVSLDPDSLNLVKQDENSEVIETQEDITEEEGATRTRKTEEFERMKKLAHRMLREEATRGLLFYVLRQEPDRVLLFIGEGAYVNVKDGIKWTPLHYAARDRQVDIAKILLAVHGIDTTIVNGSGDTAEQVVLRRKDSATEEHQKLCTDILDLLQLHKENRYPYAIYKRQLVTVEDLAQINARNVLLKEDSSSSCDEQPRVAFKAVSSK